MGVRGPGRVVSDDAPVRRVGARGAFRRVRDVDVRGAGAERPGHLRLPGRGTRCRRRSDVDPGRGDAGARPWKFGPYHRPIAPAVLPGAEPVTFTIDAAQVWDSPAGAVAARPQGWIAVRGTLSVASDGFVQLCSQLDGERCQDAAVVRGIDGVGLMVNVLQRYPGTGYQKPHLWLAQVRGGVLDDLAIGDIRTTG